MPGGVINSFLARHCLKRATWGWKLGSDAMKKWQYGVSHRIWQVSGECFWKVLKWCYRHAQTHVMWLTSLTQRCCRPVKLSPSCGNRASKYNLRREPGGISQPFNSRWPGRVRGRHKAVLLTVNEECGAGNIACQQFPIWESNWRGVKVSLAKPGIARASPWHPTSSRNKKMVQMYKFWRRQRAVRISRCPELDSLYRSLPKFVWLFGIFKELFIPVPTSGLSMQCLEIVLPKPRNLPWKRQGNKSLKWAETERRYPFPASESLELKVGNCQRSSSSS